MADMLICGKCGSEISEIEETCSTCGWYAGPPNVRSAERDEERKALEERYGKAIEDAKATGSYPSLERFDESMKRTGAVINVDLDYLHQFITGDKVMHASYSLAVKGQTRKPAAGKDDRHRRTIEAAMFGGYAEKIRYAALSLDGAGLKSWGPYSIKLREVAVSKRSTVLEDNSYNFIPKHGIQPGEDIPLGYVATWEERHRLAVAKLAEKIRSGATEGEYSKILVSSTGDRAKDDYIEVHIYGGFDNKAVESGRGSSAVKGKYERAALSNVKDYLKNAGKDWVEE